MPGDGNEYDNLDHRRGSGYHPHFCVDKSGYQLPAQNPDRTNYFSWTCLSGLQVYNQVMPSIQFRKLNTRLVTGR
jgi:hypothetical protein